MKPILRAAGSWVRPLAMLPALLLWLASAAFAQDEDPPGRVANLSHAQGSVVFAPDGEDEWVDLPLNRPLTRGDRVWTDHGARAELHLGAATVHLDGESHLAFYALDDDAAQLSLTQGSINARVRELAPRENFEIDTPNLAVRALQPGDYRVDVDNERGTTRVLVRSGQAVVFGEQGNSVQLAAGQQATFEGRNLEQVRGQFAGADDFDQWAADRNLREDQSITARYVPRHVVGYSQLDAYGTWSADPSYGAVWYPRVTVVNWAPYRYGHWSYIRPWGWTWVDEAPWGFAPFHYGRWALIGTRWAWVPGHFGPRPVYAPALVAFIGGSGASISFQIGSGPGIGWYPLAPGEAWWPAFRTSPIYLSRVNSNIVLQRQSPLAHAHRAHAAALTALRVEDFHRGRPVREHWKPLLPRDVARMPLAQTLPRPERSIDQRDRRERPPRMFDTPPAVIHPGTPGPGVFGGRTPEQWREEHRARRERERIEGEQRQQDFQRRHVERAREMERQQREMARQNEPRDLVREQQRAQREQWRLQREAEREQREQIFRQQREQMQVQPRMISPPQTIQTQPQPQVQQQPPARMQPRGQRQEAEAERGPRREGQAAGERRSQPGNHEPRGRAVWGQSRDDRP
jgi:hypothetical protein